MLSEIGELLFSLVVSYMGAIEFLFVVRHLYHWSFQHHRKLLSLNGRDEESLKLLQEQIKNAIAEAAEKETYGIKAMKDGVLYKDGFRIEVDKLSENPDFSKREIIGSSRNSLEKSENLEKVEEKKNLTEENLTEQTVQIEEVVEEPIIKKELSDVSSSSFAKDESSTSTLSADNERTTLVQTVKTQFGQTNLEQYSLPTQLPVGKSDDSSSNEPLSSQKSSSFSTQPSSSIDATMSIPEMHFDEYERQAPDGEDVPADQLQYSDEYLRSLDGIKYRPLVRDDGTGRRRAFKKRRSSGSSESSRESRASREEELKMFTSLEEEEFQTIKRGESEYSPIKYSSDPNLKVTKHHRRHKRSPVKDSKRIDKDESKSSLDMLDEEDTNPWGEGKPEHYKNTEFWKREKAISIEEELDDNNSNSCYDQETELHKPDEGSMVEKVTSPSPTKNIPTMSSFEEATESQHEDVISTLKEQGSKDTEQEEENKTVNKSKLDETKNVSSDEESSMPSLACAEQTPSAFALLSDQENPQETEETVACNQPNDHSESHPAGGLRRSPRIDEIDHYEERWEEEERRKSASPMELNESIASNDTSSLQPQHSRTKRSVTPEILEPESAEKNDFENEKVADKPHTPTIEVDFASDEDEGAPIIRIEDDDYDDEEEEDLQSPQNVMEGLSDFYDFNASINPSRSRSPSVRKSSPLQPRSPFHGRSRSASPSLIKKTPTDLSRSSPEPYNFINKSVTPLKSYKTSEIIPGLSDFYDFNLRLNQQAYNKTVKRDRDAHRSSVDYIVEELGTGDSKNELKPSISESKQSNSSHLKQEALSQKVNPKNIEDLMRTPSTPDYQRSFSAEWRDVESLREDLISNGFKRSTYVGESMDLTDEFEDLREKTRHFKRSRSKSRSPMMEEGSHSSTTKKELQDKILEEITKTTINFQDFSRNLAQDFLEHERRASDSALIQKPEILIQIQDVSQDEEYMNDLESEEYHHFRRFSLNQEYQVEEYPDDDYVYISQIQVTTVDNARNWSHMHDNTISFENDRPVSTVSVETMEDSGQAEVDDMEDSESDDERQTVVEVDDEIDEDIWDFERPDESYNEQSECEEAEREMDRYANKDADDWKEEGAVGGAVNDDDSFQIDQIYDEAIKNRKQSGIQRDYEILIEEIKNDEGNTIRREENLESDDLLEEILNEEQNYSWSPRRDRNSRGSSRESSRSFLENERREGERRYLGDAKSSAISSTRLRSRYGIVPSTSYINSDNIDNIEVDTNYKPKKEYKWRKNFKLDDDEDQSINVSEKSETSSPAEHNYEMQDENYLRYLDSRKVSVGGESITLFSRSPERSDQMQIIPDSEEQYIGNDELSNKTRKGSSELSDNSGKLLVVSPESNERSIEPEEIERHSKTKKTKKKTRKSSKGSLGNEDGELSRRSSLNDNEISDEPELNQKKRTKKKKKNKEMLEDSNTLDSESKQPEKKSKKKVKLLETINSSKIESNAETIPSPTKSYQIENLSKPEVLNQRSELEVVSTLPKLETPKSKSKSKTPEPKTVTPNIKPETSDSRNKSSLQRQESSGGFDLIKDGSMYPLF